MNILFSSKHRLLVKATLDPIMPRRRPDNAVSGPVVEQSVYIMDNLGLASLLGLLGHRAPTFPNLELSALKVFLASGACRGKVLWLFDGLIGLNM